MLQEIMVAPNTIKKGLRNQDYNINFTCCCVILLPPSLPILLTCGQVEHRFLSK